MRERAEHSELAAVRDVEVGKVTVVCHGWRGGSLYVDVEPVTEMTGWTEFRIVGVQPRMWWITGHPDVTTDVHGDCVVVRLPIASAALELTPASY
ncbi:hypothetical protein [Ilumatobacter sp.]|uniref:hypothetical protein n=1 Tax=Ilumatobacter sp. TaxID=1967498 RepID=UPI003750D9AB